MKESTILSRTFSLFFTQIGWIAAMTVAAALPLAALVWHQTLNPDFIISPRISNWLTYLLGFFAYGMGILACRDAYSKQKISWGKILRETTCQYHRILGAFIWKALAIAVGFLCLVIPGIIAFLALSCMIPVMLLEKEKLHIGFDRSWQLTKGSRSSVFLLLLGQQLIVVIAELALFFALGWMLPQAQENTLFTLSETIFAVPSYMLNGFFVTFLYFALVNKNRDCGTAAIYVPCKDLS